jgi:hypothetical protein
LKREAILRFDVYLSLFSRRTDVSHLVEHRDHVRARRGLEAQRAEQLEARRRVEPARRLVEEVDEEARQSRLVVDERPDPYI